ncbi:type VI secretion system tip protein VgrG [Rugamonas sp. FT82W]|uniref:Type VI secretion system tip protein VgrG n=1 Tax=Duganella vulcania TaxID=2692166 RepID=A0A845G3R6_9BURK|nr:type VI secretion system tip protein TssI/VgrG [Duganella vulcania]MYM89293.1 type VI secretion system tip protein VgrG [Duganella vulcania]
MRDEVKSIVAAFADGQHNRLLRLQFPNQDAPGRFLVNQLDAIEGLSRPFEYKVELLSESAHVELKDMQGKLLSVHLVLGDGGIRYFTGYVFSFGLTKVDGGIAYYEATLGPWFRFLSLRKDNYLFHQATLYEQTSSVFADYEGLCDWDWRVAGAQKRMNDACQFDESDSNYLQRRWNAAGLVYWFEHSASGHKMVLTDDTTIAAPIEGGEEVPFQRHGGALEEDGIGEWSPTRHLVQGAVAVASYDFKSGKPIVSAMPTVNRQGNVPVIESYEYTGALGFTDHATGEALARLRLEEMEAVGKLFHGAGNNRRLAPGRWFRLTGHFDGAPNGGSGDTDEFLVVEVRHRASNNYQVNAQQASDYQNQMSCLRKFIPWRPGRTRNCEETRIYGLQTATITGPAGEEIHTDEFGRVRVQFHWDRVGVRDENSSTWIRVATPWAGSNFGMTSIPRIGTEVIVSFIGGDPDRPIIIGMVPNVDTMPAWELPANKTQSGMMSRSSPGGSAQNANALRFEDKKGAEQVWLKAERDFDSNVGNDQTLTVGNNRSKVVAQDEDAFVGNNHSRRIKNSLMETVKVDALQQIGGEKNTLVGKHYKVEAGESFEITCGQAKFYMDKSGNVAITGKSINITADGPVQVNGKPIDLNSSGGAAAVTPSPKGGGAIIADVDAQFPSNPK